MKCLEVGHNIIRVPVVWATREIVGLRIRPRVCTPIPLLVIIVVQGRATQTLGIPIGVMRTLLRSQEGVCVTIAGFMMRGLVTPICVQSPHLWRFTGFLIRWVRYHVVVLRRIHALILAWVVIERLLPRNPVVRV